MSDQRAQSYKEAGVDIEKAEHFVSGIGPMIRSTFNEAVCTDLGGLHHHWVAKYHPSS